MPNHRTASLFKATEEAGAFDQNGTRFVTEFKLEVLRALAPHG